MHTVMPAKPQVKEKHLTQSDLQVHLLGGGRLDKCDVTVRIWEKVFIFDKFFPCEGNRCYVFHICVHGAELTEINVSTTEATRYFSHFGFGAVHATSSFSSPSPWEASSCLLVPGPVLVLAKAANQEYERLYSKLVISSIIY